MKAQVQDPTVDESKIPVIIEMNLSEAREFVDWLGVRSGWYDLYKTLADAVKAYDHAR